MKAAFARHPKWKTWTVAVALAAIFFVLFIVLGRKRELQPGRAKGL